MSLARASGRQQQRGENADDGITTSNSSSVNARHRLPGPTGGNWCRGFD